MSTSKPNGVQAISRAFDIFEAIAFGQGEVSVTQVSASLGIAASTSRRYVKLLMDRRLIVRAGKGRYVASNRLRRLLDQINPLSGLIAAARPALSRLSSREGATAHLGTFENDMVTYLVREGSRGIFTREHAQLEAYCTGIGKALLSLLPPSDLKNYLDMPMVEITPATITDASAMKREVAAVRANGYAIDQEEMQPGLYCIAVPLGIIADKPCAISLSYNNDKPDNFDLEKTVERLQKCAYEICDRVGEDSPALAR